MKRITIGIVAVCMYLGCSPAPRIETWVAATISVVDERLSLSPIISEAEVEHLPDWPEDQARQKILLKEFNAIWNRLNAEFRRCQKYGLYDMVDDNDNPTIRISIVLSDVEMTGDSLQMPVRLQAERLRDDQRFIYTIPAKAWVSPRERAQSPFHYYGRLLGAYRRNFPYRDIVSFFYRHKLEEP